MSTVEARSAGPRPIIVICGVGNGTGTGGHTAREFSKAGYGIALVSKNPVHLQTLTEEIKLAGGEAAYFPVSVYSYEEIHRVFEEIKQHFVDDEIRAGLWNVTEAVRKPFLEMQKEDIQKVADADIVASFSFAKECIQIFKENTINENGKRGFLVFTSATGSRRGAPNCTVSSTGKFALRSFSQSLAKEFKTENIHVAHAIVDGVILTERWKIAFGDEWYEKTTQDQDNRVDPRSIAKSYVYLSQQDRSAWTWELDLRPAHENWTW